MRRGRHARVLTEAHIPDTYQTQTHTHIPDTDTHTHTHLDCITREGTAQQL